jgi:hypothetical protein
LSIARHARVGHHSPRPGSREAPLSRARCTNASAAGVPASRPRKVSMSSCRD